MQRWHYARYSRLPVARRSQRVHMSAGSEPKQSTSPVSQVIPNKSADESLREAAAKDKPLVIDDGTSQKERMLAGRLYWSIKDPELGKEWGQCQKLVAAYNATTGWLPGTILSAAACIGCPLCGTEGRVAWCASAGFSRARYLREIVRVQHISCKFFLYRQRYCYASHLQ